MAAGTVLILCAAALLIFNSWQDLQAGKSSAKILSVLKEQIPDEIPDTIPSSKQSEESVLINGKEYIGILSIPTLNIELPIHSSWSAANARTAPCRYEGSVYDNSMIIAGHNYRRHFGNLRSLSSGDKVFFTDVNGNRFSYQVTDIERLDGYDSEKMMNGSWDLTLFTCTPGGRQRVTVRCCRTPQE